ncbi:transmembrane protein, putative [Bodo saltans]|uniref:Transmembrane protein, putative n=1 Tax=Bodo saltans TaxID=75058 RepID=A0A0S4IKN4_BODSA|nr:transmembrane protein, putative [Bodo saltans]|eukprot:CUE65535.1 transmembrane protein, putative [Bodo saltans]
MICDGTPMLNVIVVIPAPAVPATYTYAKRVEAAGGYAQIVSIIAGGASSGSALGRVMATRSMVLCDVDSTIGGGVIDFDLEICETQNASTDVAAVTARTAVVSNIVLLGVVIVAMLCLCVIWAFASSKGIRAASLDLCLPSSMLSVWIAVVPSCMSSATLLVARVGSSTCVGADVVLGILGILIASLPGGAFMLLWASRACGEKAAWVCVVKSERQNLLTEQWMIPRFAHRLLRRRFEWRLAAAGVMAADEMKASWVVLLEYRDLRYGALDASVLAAVSCVSVLSGLTGSASECRGWSLVALILMITLLMVLCTLRPLTSMFSMVISCVTLLLTVLGTIAQLVFVWALATSTSGLWLVYASAILSLIVVGVSATKMVLDLHQLIAAIHRRISALVQLPRPDDVPHLQTSVDDSFLAKLDGGTEMAVDMKSPTIITLMCPMMKTDDKEAENLTLDDVRFWDTTGAALGTEQVEGDHDILTSMR